MNQEFIQELINNAILSLNKYHDADEVYKILVSIDKNDKNAKLYINNLKNNVFKQLSKNIETMIREQIHLYLIK